MAVADHGGPVPDLYQLLGVPRNASREEIALAWRRRARAEKASMAIIRATMIRNGR
jgi:hypothetical protein